MAFATKDIVGSILTQTWQLTLLLLLVWSASRLLRRRPQLSYVICLVIICKCIVPPVWSSPTGVFSWMQAQVGRAETAVSVPIDQDADVDRYVFEPMPVNHALAADPLQSADVDVAAATGAPVIPVEAEIKPVAPAPPLPLQAASVPESIDAGKILLVAWLAGTGLFLLLWGVQFARFQRRLRHYAKRCTDPDILASVDRFRAQLGIRRQVRVLEGDAHFQACSFGIWRPTILLPAWLLQELTPDRRQHVIAHEMIHVRRGDLLHGFLQGMVQAVWWFHPLVWWFNRLMTDLRERCCDRELLARLPCNPICYAECLLQVLKGHRTHQSVSLRLATHPTMAGSRRFEQTRERIEEIMNATPQVYRRFRLRHWIVAALLAAAVLPGAALVVSTQAQSQPATAEKPVAAAPAERLKLAPDTTITLNGIDSPTSVDISNDGKFVYMASWTSGTVNVFARDASTGKLTLVQTLTKTDKEPLDGAVHIHLSPNGEYAAVNCLNDASVVLYRRDSKGGELAVLDVVRGEQTKFEDKTVLRWPSDAAWSPDGKFLYVADAHAPGAGNEQQTGHVVALQLAGKKLKVAQVFEGRDNCFANVRGLAIHPDGVTVFAASSSAGALAVMNRDAADGKLSIRQVVDSDTVSGLNGAMQVACSADGQFIYTSSGRFRDGNAVCAFKLGSDGKLKLIQSLSNAGGELPKFEGGNKIRISPDGNTVYVTATNSNHVVGLQRDLKSGKLTLTEMIDSTQLAGSPAGPCGLAFSPDGKHLYVTWEFSKAVSAFVRQNGLISGVETNARRPPGLAAEVEIKDFRVTPGIGLRIAVPQLQGDMPRKMEFEKKDQIRKDIETKKAELAANQGAYKRLLPLARQGAVSAQEISELESKIKTCEHAIAQGTKLLEDLEATLKQLDEKRAAPPQPAQSDLDKQKLEMAKLQQKIDQLEKLAADQQMKAQAARDEQMAMQRLAEQMRAQQEKKAQDAAITAAEQLRRAQDKKKAEDPPAKDSTLPKKAPAKQYQVQLLELDVAEAQLTLERREKELKRAESLREKGTVSSEDLDEARYAYEKAKIALKRAAVKLDQARHEAD